MNRGMSMSELIHEVKRRKTLQQDRLVPSSMMQMADNGMMEFDNQMLIPMPVAHGNISELTGIPKIYYNKLLKVPGLLAQNVNYWWPQEGTRFVRTYDMTEMRAILSDAYQPLEYDDMTEALVPHLYEAKDRFRIKSANLTERRMNLQFIDTQLEAEIQVHRGGARVGELVNGGFNISDSEVGEGKAEISMFIWVYSCSNGAIREHTLSKVHLGKRIGNGHVQIYKEDTRKAAIELFRKEVRDALDWGFDQTKFREEVEKFQLAADNTFKPSEAQKVIKDVTGKHNMTQAEGKTILDNLMASADFSLWGLANAVTAMAHDESVDIDKAIEYERIGGKILG